MTDRDQLAVAARAQADPLNGRRAMRGVVRHQRTRQRDLDRTAHRARAERRKDGIRANAALSAEAAADEGRDDANAVLRHADLVGEVTPRPANDLLRRPDCEMVAVPPRDGGMRLHHHVTLVRRGVGLVNGHCGRGERVVEIADPDIGLALMRLGTSPRCGEIEGAFFARIIDPNQRRRSTSLLEGFGDDQRDRLMIMLDRWGRLAASRRRSPGS